MVITIDGPTGSGKGSVARALASILGFVYLETGALYRAVAYVLRHEYAYDLDALSREQVLALGSTELAFIPSLSYDHSKDGGRVIYGDKDLTPFLYDAANDRAASKISAHPLVRQLLLEVQRETARKYNVVADGRDCGSVVFPDAEIKFFLTADCQERARRVQADPKRKLAGCDLATVKAMLEERDARDATRAVAPLVVPAKAMVIDNTGISQKETVDRFLWEVQKQWAC